MSEPSVFAFRAFVVTAEYCHFTRAAKALHITVPALSQSIRRLEDQLGVQLFIRSSRGVELSDGGMDLLPLASEILLAHDRVQRWKRQRNEPVLRVGFVSPGAPSWISRLLAEVTQRQPGLRLELQQVERENTSSTLRRGEVDVVFLWGPEPPDTVTIRTVAFSNRVLILNSNELLKRFGNDRESATLLELKGLRYITPLTSDEDYIDWVLADPRSDGSRALQGPKAQNLDEVFAMVAAGLGAYILPSTVAKYHTHEDVSYIDLDEVEPAPFRLCASEQSVSPITSWFVGLVDEFRPGGRFHV